MGDLFRRIAAGTSCALGSPWAFLSAVAYVLVWALAGPMFNWSDGWQLLINTSTTIGTFLMIFIVQNSQNRDTKAINIKLDELLRAIRGARTGLVNLNQLSDEELEELESQFQKLGQRAMAAEARAMAKRVEKSVEKSVATTEGALSGKRPRKAPASRKAASSSRA
jgi:low affinity Fe/Cu permease